jgi:hypothetical protein
MESVSNREGKVNKRTGLAQVQIELPKPPLPPGATFTLPSELKTATAQSEKAEPQCFELLVFEEVKKHLSSREITAFESLVRPYLDSKPSPKESIHVKPEEKINDLDRLKRAKDRSRGEPLEKKINYIRAKIFEALLNTLIELYWIPDEAFITETSEFDDWLNGADAILETRSLLVIIDFTSQQDREGLRRKVEKIFQRIDQGTLGSLKYFKSQFTQKMLPPRQMIPSVIIGLSQANIESLLSLYLSKKTTEIKNHWIRHAIAEEILRQANFFKKYINNPNRRSYRPDTAKIMSNAYDNLSEAIYKLMPHLQSSQEGSMPEVKRPDSVYNLIMQIIT